MIEKNTNQRTLAYFFTNPSSPIHLRELSRQLKLSMPTVIRAVRTLGHEKLITIDRSGPLTLVRANLDNPRFFRLKRVHNLEQIYECGLVDAIVKASNHPQAIVLFGSYARGEDIERSDIDIAIIGGRTENPPEKFEKVLRRSVSFHHVTMDRVSPEFQAEIGNGIVLEGAL